MEPKIPFLKKRALNKKLRLAPSVKRSLILSPSEYKKILLVKDEKGETSAAFLAKLFPDTEIHSLYHRPKKEEENAPNSTGIHHSDFSLSGNPISVKLQQLMQQRFDLVIDLSANSVALAWIVKSMNASLIVGQKSLSLPIAIGIAYDLVVTGGKTEAEFLENVKKQIELLSNGK